MYRNSNPSCVVLFTKRPNTCAQFSSFLVHLTVVLQIPHKRPLLLVSSYYSGVAWDDREKSKILEYWSLSQDLKLGLFNTKQVCNTVYKHLKLVTLYFNTKMVQIFVSALQVVCCFVAEL
jgi:hypothetical protein